MNTSKAVGVFAYSDEKTQVEQIREFLNEKGASLPAFNQDKLFENVLAIIKASEVLGQLTNEKDVENVLNSLFSLIITFEAGLAQKLVEAFAQVLSSDKFHDRDGSLMLVLQFESYPTYTIRFCNLKSNSRCSSIF